MKMIYTFGKGQEHKGRYVITEGKDRETCRNEMIRLHDMNWAYSYEFSRLGDIQRAGLRELK